MKRKGFSTSMVAMIGAAFLLSTLITTQSSWAQSKQPQQSTNKVYRWVDEDGNVHYSETLPPNWKGETHDELGGDGVMRQEDISHAPPPPPKEEPDADAGKTQLPRDKSGLKRPEPLYTDAEKQQRMDRLLLLRYDSEEELLEAMEVEINQLNYDERLLNSAHSSLDTSLRSAIDIAGNRQRAGLEVKDETLREIRKIRAQLDENQRSLHGLKKREDDIRATFTRDLERYRELVETYSEEETG